MEFVLGNTDSFVQVEVYATIIMLHHYSSAFSTLFPSLSFSSGGLRVMTRMCICMRQVQYIHDVWIGNFSSCLAGVNLSISVQDYTPD